MKKLFVTLVLMSASLCAFAQTDYISQAQAAVKKYYPQHVEYFNPIFAKINNLKSDTKSMINNRIKGNLELFDEELPTDKDKMTTILLVLEKLLEQSQFIKSFDVGIKKTEDFREEIAKEIASEIIADSKKRLAAAEGELAAAEGELAVTKAKNSKLKEIINLVNNSNDKNKETAKNIVLKMDEFFGLYDDNELRKDIEEDASIQKIINQYINLTKEYGITPSASGKRVIDAYNKYHK
jgi:hypothetical protein